MKHLKVEVYCGIKYVYTIYKKSTTTADAFTLTAENLYKIVLTNAVKLNVNFSRD